MHMQLTCEGVVGGVAIVSGWLPHGQPSVASVLAWTMQKVDASFDPRNVSYERKLFSVTGTFGSYE